MSQPKLDTNKVIFLKAKLLKGAVLQPIGPTRSWTDVMLQAQQYENDSIGGWMRGDWEHNTVRFRKLDSIGAKWERMGGIADSGSVVRQLLGMIMRNEKRFGEDRSDARHDFDSSYHYWNKLLDSANKQIRKADQVSTRWANITKWLMQDYGVTQKDFMQMLKKHGYNPANLNNEKITKKKL